jgi:Cu2+-exporting ATPase
MLILTGLIIATSLLTYTGIKKKKIPENKKEAEVQIQKITLHQNKADKDAKALQIISPEKEDMTKNTQNSHNLSVASISLGCMVTGQIIFPPLTLLGVGGLTYLIWPTWKQGYHDLVKRRRFSRMVLESFILPGTLLSGYFLPTAFTYWFLYFSLDIVAKAKGNTSKNLSNLFIEPAHQTVYILRDDIEIESKLEEIKKDDILIISAGEIIPVDGLIIKGHATLDEHMLTGESQPVEKAIGDEVFSATILLIGHIQIRVKQTGEDTIANQTRLILDGMTSFTEGIELKGTETADRLALPYFLLGSTMTVIKGASSGLAIVWSPLDDALYMAGPLSALNYINIALERGILIKDGRALETFQQVSTIVFDETGTLTHDIPSVVKIHAYGQRQEIDILRYAAAAEQKQVHPVAQAILNEALIRELELPAVTGSSYKTGYGLSVLIDDKTVQVGSYRFMEHLSITLPKALQISEKQSHDLGYSLVYIVIDNLLAGAIELHATVRADAIETVDKLHQLGYQICIISGDHEKPTQHLAQQLGIECYFSETLPQDKANIIQSMQDEGEVICYVGDGINDTIALKQAEVSVSLKGASTIATDTAQIVLMNGELKQLVSLIELSAALKKTYKNTVLSSAIPTTGIIGGVVFFHVGLPLAITAYMLGIGMSVTHAMLPVLKERSKNTNKDS